MIPIIFKLYSLLLLNMNRLLRTFHLELISNLFKNRQAFGVTFSEFNIDQMMASFLPIEEYLRCLSRLCIRSP
jgi:hypothetical protein